LAVNSGSSSLKFALYQCGLKETLLFSGAYSGIGSENSRLSLQEKKEQSPENHSVEVKNHEEAVENLIELLDTKGVKPDAVSHRIVQGGPKYREPKKVDEELLKELKKWQSLAPEHLPQEIAMIEAFQKRSPEAQQIACFDTAFHKQRPVHRQKYALPQEFFEQGVMRYGFHGLSYESIVLQLLEDYPQHAYEKLIICHLGHGASLAAVNKGKPVDTTMGFSPVSGLVMSTRTGELDPLIPLYLQQEKGMSGEEVRTLVHQQAGLLGLSKISAEMKVLLEEEERDKNAEEAVLLFCESIIKSIGASRALMQGLNGLIFTGGIGENSPEIRERICKHLSGWGILLDQESNEKNDPLISERGSDIAVFVLSTNEEKILARHAKELIGGKEHAQT